MLFRSLWRRASFNTDTKSPEREVAEAPVEELLDGPLPSSSSKVPHPEPEAIPLPAVHVAPPCLLSSCQRQWPSLDVRQLQLPRRTLGLAVGCAFYFADGNIHKIFFATKDHVTYSIHSSSRLPQQLSPFHVLLLSF